MKKIQQFIATVTTFALALPVAVSAQNGLTVPQKPQGLADAPTGRLSEVLLTYINLFLGIVGIIAVAFIIYGGFRYIVSAGNEEAAEAGKKTLTNAVVGLVIIIFAYAIVRVVINVLVNRQA